MIRRLLHRRTMRKTAAAADAYLGSGLAAFAAARQAERAALTHEEADAIIAPQLARLSDSCQRLSPAYQDEVLGERMQEFAARYPNWKGHS